MVLVKTKLKKGRLKAKVRTPRFLPVKVKAEIKKGKLKAKVKYPLVGRAKLELGTTNMLKAVVKVPFIAKAKLLAYLKLKKKNEKKKQ